jgi:hypothetical protein
LHERFGTGVGDRYFHRQLFGANGVNVDLKVAVTEEIDQQ